MPVRQLGLMVNSFARASTCGTRLFALLDLDARHQGRARTPRTSSSPRACCASTTSASATRAPATPDAVRHLASRRRRGETIGIVGPPGSGKSTIAHLIPRFYDVSGGRDHHRRPGHPRGDAAIAAQGRRRGAAGLVPVHDHDREQHRLRQSVGAASSASSAPPNSPSCTTTSSGFRPATTTVVGERGVSLSGGQRQRLSIARSLMLRPVGAGLRRFHRGDRRRHRAAHPRGDEALRQGARDAHHLAPAELADACRPDPVRRGRPHRRARHA